VLIAHGTLHKQSVLSPLEHVARDACDDHSQHGLCSLLASRPRALVCWQAWLDLLIFAGHQSDDQSANFEIRFRTRAPGPWAEFSQSVGG